jgi:hypothetical protein
MRAVCLIALLLVGCAKTESPQATQSPPSDPHDVPITEADVKMPASYAEAIPQIKGYRDTIRQAIEAGTPSGAHRSLDELDIVLNKLPSIAKESGVPKEQWEAINTASQELRNSFNQLHSAIDEKREPDYKAVADPIEQAIATLEQVAP